MDGHSVDVLDRCYRQCTRVSGIEHYLLPHPQPQLVTRHNHRRSATSIVPQLSSYKALLGVGGGGGVKSGFLEDPPKWYLSYRGQPQRTTIQPPR